MFLHSPTKPHRNLLKSAMIISVVALMGLPLVAQAAPSNDGRTVSRVRSDNNGHHRATHQNRKERATHRRDRTERRSDRRADRGTNRRTDRRTDRRVERRGNPNAIPAPTHRRTTAPHAPAHTGNNGHTRRTGNGSRHSTSTGTHRRSTGNGTQRRHTGGHSRTGQPTHRRGNSGHQGSNRGTTHRRDHRTDRRDQRRNSRHNSGHSYGHNRRRSNNHRNYRSHYRSNLGINFIFGNSGFSNYRWATSPYSLYSPGRWSYASYRNSTSCNRVMVEANHHGHVELISVKECYNSYDGYFVIQGSERIVDCPYGYNDGYNRRYY